MSGEQVQLVITGDGNVRAIYSERIDLGELGKLSIRRGSHVEPTDDGRWTADLSPCGGPLLGPFAVRSEAIEAEVAWLVEHWLDSPLFLAERIVWDTEGIDADELGLPSQVLVRAARWRIADLLSDHFGWCVQAMDVELCDETLVDARQAVTAKLPLIVDPGV